MKLQHSRNGHSKSSEMPQSKSGKNPSSFWDIVPTPIVMAVCLWYCIHWHNQSKQSNSAISNGKNDNALEFVSQSRQHIVEFQQQAQDEFKTGFLNALEENKQQILNECMAGSAGSSLTATSSKVDSMRIDWLDRLRPLSAEDALKQISSYRAVATIFWKGPGNAEGYSVVELTSNRTTGKAASFRLIKTQSSANLN